MIVRELTAGATVQARPVVVFEEDVRTAGVRVRARYVGWGNHDACAVALPVALADVEAGRLADRGHRDPARR
ncbi:hypothetical protein [Streptomyces uncialis]|uniref:hypothetical protein n=1 Tax=Streptomyces uncialis TaxID=1048205 RepID=UPI0033E49996